MPAKSLALVITSGLMLAGAAPAAAEITALGVGRVDVHPSDRQSNDSIKTAVASARDRSVGFALGDARARAAKIAAEAGMPLGAITAVEEEPAAPPYFFGPFGAGAQGTFGPGRYCGHVTRVIFAPRRPGDTRRRVTGRRTVRSCRVPREATTTLSVTFATS